MRIAVIGAGPAGMTAAYLLSKHNFDVEVFEAGTRVGGLAKTIELWNQKVDLGPHRFFCSDRRVNELWLEVLGKDFIVVDRLTRIYYRRKLFHYPLKPLDALAKLGTWEAFRCTLSYAKQSFRSTQPSGTFEDWVVNRFGRRLFEIFFKTYSEKLWGISCQDLDDDFAAQRIKKLSLFEALKNALTNGRGNTHKTLIDRFVYPKYGSGMVYERMADLMQRRGGTIHFRTAVHKVLTENRRAYGLEFEDGATRQFDHIISSMPLSLLVSRLPEAPVEIRQRARSLKFRNTILVYLKVDSTDLFRDNWIYIHEAELKVGRVTNFRNWSPDLYSGERVSVLALEYWCDDKDAIWEAPHGEIIELAKGEIQQTGLTKNAAILDGFVHKIHRCYPVYFRGYKQVLEPIEAYLNTISGLKAIGRYGAYKYNNQDHSILMGMLAADDLINNRDHHLWHINTDFDSYQESANLEASSLVEAKKV